MKTSLFKGLSPEEKSDLKGSFKASVVLRKQLRLVLADEVKQLNSSMLVEDNYEDPNWALKQVAKIAQIKANIKLMSFLVD